MNLRAGDWVEVRRADEIVATLDEDGCVNGLPFMPEMLKHCGKRFRIHKTAHKTCDTIESFVIRRMDRAVHLEGLRCDGQAHGGCEAGCLLFWKEDWLRKVETENSGNTSAQSIAPAGGEADHPLEYLSRSTRQRPVADETEPRYRCQATEVLRATSEVRRRDRWNPLFYVKDLTSGNVPFVAFVWFGLCAAFNAFTLRWLGVRRPRLCGLSGKDTPTEVTNLQVGELVRVRDKAEIMKTLNPGLRNRGLWFDVEMVPYCGSRQTVLRRVEKIVDERTGRMMRFSNPCIILDDVTCSGNMSMSRMFCPRAVYPYWREIWLERTK